MRALLSRPYRLTKSGPSAWSTAVGFGAFVFLFLWFFQPFGLDQLDRSLATIALGYGVVCTAVMLLLNGLVPQLLPSFFSEPRWTVGRELGWTLVNVGCIGLANTLYSMAIGITRPGWDRLLWFEGSTLLIGIFPVTAVILLNEARLSRRYREGSEHINAQERRANATPAPAETSTKDTLLVLPSETGREDITVSGKQLLFIRSSGNYLEVYQLVGDTVTRKVVRGSLKRVEEAWSDNPQLLRCHKSHMVNLGQVERVSGNAQGYRLHLRHGADTVPVSRQLNNRLGAMLADRP